jgi:hypothetical protein
MFGRSDVIDDRPCQVFAGGLAYRWKSENINSGFDNTVETIMARRTLNRKDLRAQADAVERARQEEDADEEEEVDEEADDEAEDEAEETDEEEGGEEEEIKPAKKKKAAPKAPKAAKPKSRSRAAKTSRLKVVWGVFNNSNQRVATFDYPKRKEADDLAAKLTGDKKNTHFVQPIKEPIEEKEPAAAK